jgi:hypothetical protein
MPHSRLAVPPTGPLPAPLGPDPLHLRAFNLVSGAHADDGIVTAESLSAAFASIGRPISLTAEGVRMTQVPFDDELIGSQDFAPRRSSAQTFTRATWARVLQTVIPPGSVDPRRQSAELEAFSLLCDPGESRLTLARLEALLRSILPPDVASAPDLFRDVAAVFNWMDADGNGEVGAGDFAAVTRRAEQHPDELVMPTKEQLQKRIEERLAS